MKKRPILASTAELLVGSAMVFLLNFQPADAVVLGGQIPRGNLAEKEKASRSLRTAGLLLFVIRGSASIL